MLVFCIYEQCIIAVALTSFHSFASLQLFCDSVQLEFVAFPALIFLKSYQHIHRSELYLGLDLLQACLRLLLDSACL